MSRPRPLRTKILLTLGGVTVLFIVAVWTIQQWTILPSFRALEERQALSDVDRATEAIHKEVEHVDDFLSDWSGWDDTYRFVQDGYEEYVHSNLDHNVFRDDSFDFICFVRPDGTQAWRGGRAPDGSPTLVAELPQERWPLDHPLLLGHVIDEPRTGILLTGQGPLLLAARPITDSARKAPPRGWLVMGRFLNAARIAALARQTRLELLVLPSTGALAARAREALERLRAGPARDLAPLDAETLEASAFLPALAGGEGLLVRVVIERSVLAQGRQALDFALFTTLASGAIVFAVLFFMLQRIVVGPLTVLKRHAVSIGASDELSARCALQSDDEIGVLAREFDAMVERLAESQGRLVEAARQGGMSEVASSVLHDVGNALQGLHASHGALVRRLSDRKLEDLERVSSLLAEHAHELDRWLAQDPKGRRLPPFLQALARSLVEERAGMRGDLGTLAVGLEHIHELLAAQQQNAGRRGALERVDAGTLLEESLCLTEDGAQPAPVVVREFGAQRQLRIEKHKLLAILVNLVRNARQALQAVAPRQGTIVLRVGPGEDRRLRIVVEDDGAGIELLNLERLFQGGFTSKAEGHGLGLHGCANSVREMEGRLWAESAGRGRGARFVLELPVEAPLAQESAA
jgi:sensor domain CHASE-containing protein/anti-sigma regulatory factor (Ser/Thr protein kinase)